MRKHKARDVGRQCAASAAVRIRPREDRLSCRHQDVQGGVPDLPRRRQGSEVRRCIPRLVPGLPGSLRLLGHPARPQRPSEDDERESFVLQQPRTEQGDGPGEQVGWIGALPSVWALDITITKTDAPWVVFDNRNVREFVSARTLGYRFQPANASADLNTFFAK